MQCVLDSFNPKFVITMEETTEYIGLNSPTTLDNIGASYITIQSTGYVA
jgi:hypothetical protein